MLSFHFSPVVEPLSSRIGEYSSCNCCICLSGAPPGRSLQEKPQDIPHRVKARSASMLASTGVGNAPYRSACVVRYTTAEAMERSVILTMLLL